MTTPDKHWSLMFIFAAGFNFCMGGAIVAAPAWSYSIAYIGDASVAVLRFWSDFGLAVILLGIGYWIVSRNINRNRGIVWMGIFAKAFDVMALSGRWTEGIAHPIVLLPAAIDGGFIILFILFLRATPVPDSKLC